MPRGRPLGSKNKVTRSIKEAFLEVFARLGGADGLEAWARENPDKFYGMTQKLIPTALEGKVEHEHSHEHRAVSEVDSRIAELLGSGQDSDSPPPRAN